MQTIDIFGRENCSYCTMAKAWCEEKGIPYRYHDVHAADVRADLMGRLKVPPKTVPVVMVGKVEVAGGYTGMKAAWASGVLQQLIGGE